MKNCQGNKQLNLMDAALNLFTEYGFHGTPTSKIAEAAGVAAGTLFNYFKTKEELINRLYLDIKREMTSVLATGVEVEQTIRGKIRKLWLNYITWSLQYPKKLQFFLQFRSSPFISNLTHEEAGLQMTFLYALLDEGKRQDVLKPLPTELLFDIATGFAQVFALHFLRHREHFADEAYCEQAFGAYWDGIKR
jgi:AcrR family transcriptional regulator